MITDEPTVRLRGVCLSYAASDPVLQGLDLELWPGQVVAVMGPSGTGKSSLLGVVSGLLAASAGAVEVAGHNFATLDGPRRAAVRRRHLGMVFQAPELLPELCVRDNVALTMIFDGAKKSTSRERAQAALDDVGLAALGDRRVDEISGGEAQRVALARALVRPDMLLLVADEPTASLDQDTAQQVISLLCDNVRRRDAGAIVATHDPRVAARCDLVLDLRELAAAR